MAAIIGVGCTLVGATCALGAAPAASAETVARQEANAPRNPSMNAYFGELHVHTAYSLDGYFFGNTMNDPFVAYRFAKGEEVVLPNGAKKTIRTPLDFTAVTDHAEVLGEYEICSNPEYQKYASTICEGIRTGDLKPLEKLFSGLANTPATRLSGLCGRAGRACVAAAAGPWQRIQQAAADNYEPGRFTSFVAYEYSANAPEGMAGMMHRNVIYRSADVPQTLFSAYDGSGEQLQAWLANNCKGHGNCDVMTIPHNANFYWGRLYWGKNSDGTPWTRDVIERRAAMDRLVEIMQVKGNSECQTGIGTTDEDCNFELLFKECAAGENTLCSNEYAFVRNGLKLGLRHEASWGVNPFKQGFVGATDNHNGTPGDSAENDYQGHYGTSDGSPDVRLGLTHVKTEAGGLTQDDDPTSKFNPGALTGVWAQSNTRPDIWDALYRRETFATSGTRVRLRMFAGFDFPNDSHSKRDWVETAYLQGVPQGGDLTSAPEGKAPTLIVWAAQDPQSAPLAKLQIIKGWVTSGDELRESTYDIACSDGAVPDTKSHRCPDNGATVNPEDCSISTDKGAAQLATTWRDPDFNPAERAFYYARVLENPVCRWSMYDANKLGVTHPPGLPTTIRERAWSSPVWYAPK